jgi:RNA-directed DNA polymerase
MNIRLHFTQSLAGGFCSSQWHFKTLLSNFIESVNGIPDDAGALISELLVAFPEKPSNEVMEAYLYEHERIRNWFSVHSARPSILKYDLAAYGENTVQEGLPSFNNITDLAHWLNISVQQLEWLADIKRHAPDTPHHLQHYHYSLIKKRRGGVRLIESPKFLLKTIQRKINHEIILQCDVHEAAHGFRAQKSCKTHAAIHVGKRYVFLFDLAHYFHSIQWHQVYRLFMQFAYSRSVSKYLTGLCTHKSCLNYNLLSQLDSQQRTHIGKRHLAQGAPSSPALSNAVLYRLDKRLAGLAKRLGLDYSRYADDLAFSGNTHRDWQFLEPLVGSICIEEGFSLNHRKTKVMRSHQKQKITGIVVNSQPNIDRDYYDRLKATLTNCVRHGLQSQNRMNYLDFKAHLMGAIAHVKSLNKVKGEKLEQIFSQMAID